MTLADGLERLSRLAARALNSETATITLLDAADGTGDPPEPLDPALVRMVLEQRTTVAITDLQIDSRTRDLSFEQGIGGFIGAPLVAGDGYVLGVLGVLDSQARIWTPGDLETITDLASTAVAEIELRRAVAEAGEEAQIARDQQHVLDRIAAAAPLAETLELIVRTIEARSTGMRCSILLLDPDGRTLRTGAAPSLPQTFSEAIDGVEIGPVVGSCGTAAYRRQAVIVEDIATDPLWAAWRELALGCGLRACWSTPIIAAHGEVLGTFAMYYGDTRGPTATHRMLIQRATHLARIAIERVRVGGELAESVRRASALAAEQAALRRVATAVAGGEAPQRVAHLISEELCALLDVDAATAMRFDDDGRVTLLGGHSTEGSPPLQSAGTRFAVTELGLAGQVLRGLRQARLELSASGSEYPHRLGVPILRDGAPWGYIAVAGTSPLSDDAIDRLRGFGELLATATANAEAREQLAALATADSLTGLLNQRAFRQQLEGEAERGARRGTTLALALFDIDGFKRINDTYGHQTGDTVLIEVARAISAVARTGEAVARIGGDELALLLPDCDATGAFAAAERVRRSVGELRVADLGRITLSAGVADTVDANTPDDLVRHADDALYWAKEHGRDAVARYARDTVRAMSGAERGERLARAQETAALAALARAVDTRDTPMCHHSGRVADVAALLGRAAGWPSARVAQLREAALLHDVGKLGVPEVLLTKRGPLSPDERVTVCTHPGLGALIAAEVLGGEQASWIRHHHERPDGAGYPDGLQAGEIPDGAQLIGLAEAWDAMIHGVGGRPPKTISQALDECRRGRGTQFGDVAVDALELAWSTGDLVPVTAARRVRVTAGNVRR